MRDERDIDGEVNESISTLDFNNGGEELPVHSYDGGAILSKGVPSGIPILLANMLSSSGQVTTKEILAAHIALKRVQAVKTGPQVVRIDQNQHENAGRYIYSRIRNHEELNELFETFVDFGIPTKCIVYISDPGEQTLELLTLIRNKANDLLELEDRIEGGSIPFQIQYIFEGPIGDTEGVMNNVTRVALTPNGRELSTKDLLNLFSESLFN